MIQPSSGGLDSVTNNSSEIKQITHLAASMNMMNQNQNNFNQGAVGNGGTEYGNLQNSFVYGQNSRKSI